MSSVEKFKGISKKTILVVGIVIIALFSYDLRERQLAHIRALKNNGEDNPSPLKPRGQVTENPVKSIYKYSSLFKECHDISHSDDLDGDSLVRALNESIKYLRRKSSKSKTRYGSTLINVKDVIRMTADIRDGVKKWGLGEQFTDWLNSNFVFLQVREKEFIVTGYYLPFLKGSSKKTGTFKYPLYRSPDDLVRVSLKEFDFYDKIENIPPSIKGRLTTDMAVVPYWKRQDIDFNETLEGRDLEIAWTDDPVALHNLHVQGSGIIEFPDGTIKRYGYGNSNGFRFKGISTRLRKSGMLPEGINTPVEINEFLLKRPELWEETFSINPRYLFFRELKGEPVGSLGVEITAHRTIAADQNIFPSGAIALLETSIPEIGERNQIIRWKKIRRFVVNQDSGNAIRGKGHIDLFCGFGDKNREIAASMRQKGKMWFILRKKQREEK
jgi:membrane-bound lytic murein transglycosylase A